MAGRVLRTNIHIRGLWTKSSIGSVRYVLPSLSSLFWLPGAERERESNRFAFEACPPAETRLEFVDRVPGIEAPSEERREVSLHYWIVAVIRNRWQAYLDRVCLGLRWHRGKILLDNATMPIFPDRSILILPKVPFTLYLLYFIYASLAFIIRVQIFMLRLSKEKKIGETRWVETQ